MTATLTARDAEYRRALRLTDGQAYPKSIGQTKGHARNPHAASHTKFYGLEPPPGANLVVASSVLTRKRSAIARRSVPKGDIDAQLDEYAEAITHAAAARDNARTKPQRQAAGAYLIRLVDQRDALMRSAHRQPRLADVNA